MDTKIKYNYHDSYIDDVEIDKDGVTFSVFLSALYYPDTPKVKIELTDIFNYQNVSKYFRSILTEADEDGIGCGIEAMYFDTKVKSNEGSMYIYLKTAWEGGIRIHCVDFEECPC